MEFELGTNSGNIKSETKADVKPALGASPETDDSDVMVGESHDLEEDKMKRSISPRQIHIISFGSNIGSGLFVATGKALNLCGPGNMIFGYGLICSCVSAVLQTASEMTIAFPVSGNFINYADRWLDPSLAFAAGLAEWLGYVGVAPAEATVFVILVRYWASSAINEAVWLAIFTAVCLIIFALPNKYFAMFEYVTSICKIVGFAIMIVTSLAITLGAGPEGYIHSGANWTGGEAFRNGFRGFGQCCLLGIWAVGDQVFTGIMGGEATNPRFSIGHATVLVPYRVSFFYMVTVIFVSVLVPMDDSRLFGASGVAASPFVIAMNDVGIKGLPDLINLVMIVGVVAIAAESIYIASRVLRALAGQGLVPKIFAKVDSRGRPTWSLAVTLSLSVVLTFINLSSTGTLVFGWFSSITASSFMIVWIVIALTSWRFRTALRVQKDPLFTQTYAFSCYKWPIPPIWLLFGCIMLLISCFYIAVQPLGSTSFSISNFLQYTLGIIIVVVFTIAHKIIYKTKWRDPATCDLVTGRRNLSADEIRQLDDYYRLPTWRRFMTYVQLW